jgi:hypothetical protein
MMEEERRTFLEERRGFEKKLDHYKNQMYI